MLEIRPNCESCDKDLPPHSQDALICTFECTFCIDCAASFPDQFCPNCGGNLVARPLRPVALLEKYPASTLRVRKAIATTGSSATTNAPRFSSLKVRPITKNDAAHWVAMRAALWPECDSAEHEEESGAFFGSDKLPTLMEVLVAESIDEELVGFVELGIRDYAEGCTSGRVAYLEGWFVEPGHRKAGVGRALISASEQWGRNMGCSEFASDADTENSTSVAAHRALGFADMGCARLFRKDL